ncbi:MAG TPA: histidine phosphatase family protein [Acidimicrobiales bacterium]|nr:histidine phosphatase family protein [Acidimicrobiales bacterium]
MSHRPPVGLRTLGTGPVQCRLVLVRHGEPVNAVLGVVGGPTGDTGLTDAGRAQAACLAARLEASGELAEATALYASSLPRAIETAQVLAPALGGLEPVVRHDLREHDPGDLDGLTWAEAEARYALPDFDAEPHKPVGPGGESLTGFHLRARTALGDLALRHPGATVVVCCHGGIVAAAVGMVFDVDPSVRVLLPTAYCSMTEVDRVERGWRLARYNDRYPVRDDLA